MSNRRHNHHGPRVQIRRSMYDENGVIAQNGFVYHPTKGWRKIRNDVTPGFYKIDALMARLRLLK